uniref:Acyl carrier protein n=1 Tax=Candidatus Kentrum sp. FW TaxID=2126338 RepID=A0A450SFX8_9GAMM|nr:MAG: acyl carrier protein [Candidatus Kentron sp. FW]
MTEDILQKLKQIISEELDINLKPQEIDENASLFEEGLGIDSVVLMEFIGLIEANFGLQFTDEELSMEPFTNLTALAELISRKRASQ